MGESDLNLGLWNNGMSFSGPGRSESGFWVRGLLVITDPSLGSSSLDSGTLGDASQGQDDINLG